MLSNHEKIKAEKRAQNGERCLNQVYDYEDIAPYWLIEAAYIYISGQISDLRKAIETGDETDIALAGCAAFARARSPLDGFSDEWGITDIKKWITYERRDMRRAEKVGNWKGVASCALRIGECEAAIAELRKRRDEKRREIAA
ncbi:hypothetical protein [Sagittula stellata]|uniref:Uncharacterized protein n=1 Tax=Sagittula stellata (strain ATCC 700073 / DSM 11524 / E-37) TaxID=388399 RepID=A3K8E5_SAGS3|nr:hypothetical protein [Sagittula stellata]EBA06624.1 hypothetical protein SSE37_10223 [Sagittula stellata E-37]